MKVYHGYITACKGCCRVMSKHVSCQDWPNPSQIHHQDDILHAVILIISCNTHDQHRYTCLTLLHVVKTLEWQVNIVFVYSVSTFTLCQNDIEYLFVKCFVRSWCLKSPVCVSSNISCWFIMMYYTVVVTLNILTQHTCYKYCWWSCHFKNIFGPNWPFTLFCWYHPK